MFQIVILTSTKTKPIPVQTLGRLEGCVSSKINGAWKVPPLSERMSPTVDKCQRRFKSIVTQEDDGK